jgi:Skp family chaperone for outer membrane proteins
MAKQTGGRQYVHILLDPVTYLKLKASGENMSQLGNRLFESYFELHDKDIPEEIELLDEMKRQEDAIKEAKEKLNEISVMLAKARQDRSIREKEEEELREEKHDLARQLFREQQMEQIRNEANKRR